MQKLIITTLFSLFLATPLFAAEGDPDRGDRRGPPPNPAERLTQELGLSQEQSTQVEVIFEEARLQHEALREANREEHQAIRDATDAQLAGVLTADQMTQMESMRSRHEGRGHRREGQRRTPQQDAD
jgi:hypothetical protein